MNKQIEKWINDDQQLFDLLVEIQSLNHSEIMQAEIAFYKLGELYDLPITPDDINYQEIEYENIDMIEPRSLYEEYALLRFLFPHDDPRGIVLLAVYHVKNNVYVDYYEIAKKEFGNQIPQNLQIGIKGDGFHSKVIFPQKEGKSWHDLGCKINNKLY